MPDERRLLCGWLTAVLLAVVMPSALQAQAAGADRAALIRAEDARGKGPAGIQPILDGLRLPTLRPIAIRAIGRLERPELVGHIIPFLSDPALTATTAEALAQSLRGLAGDSARVVRERALVDSIFRLLRDRGRVEQNAAARGAIARSIGRLPYAEPRQARAADSVLISLAPLQLDGRGDFSAVAGAANALYTLTRSRRTLGQLSAPAVEWLQMAGLFELTVPLGDSVRRAAWLALTANGTIDRRLVSGAILLDTDPQVRRLAVAALPNVRDAVFQKAELDRASRDSDPMVRLEWVRVYRQLIAATDCRPLLGALTDTVHHVRLAAIDALGGPCPERDTVIVVLKGLIESGPAGVSSRASRGVSWHARAHALTALARVDSTVATPLLRRDGRHPVWQVRTYVARGATITRDSLLLTSLAFDTVGNVREVAIQGLSSTVGHVADLVYVRALGSRDYHVVLAAARALRGAPARDSVRPAVLDALERLSREQRQTSRDPRMELLARVSEVGSPADTARLRRLLADPDEAVANETATVMNKLAGSSQYSALPVRMIRVVAPPAGNVRVRVTMAASTGGGTFDLILDADRAPMTVRRVVELIGTRYYDGLTFHRVVPNFVLQGGSPAMNEYVGDGPFMRDELSLEHHARYTLGISTRGRDTGDAQWFINLVDNYRLDHDYTVFARVVSGFAVVDRILEGDVMESVRVVPD